MGILDTITRATKSPETTTNTAAAASPASSRPSSQIWVNVGVSLPGMGPELPDGSREDLFISLPVGIPLDSMQPVKITGTNPQAIQLKQAKNEVLEAFQQAGASLKPGERRALPGVSVEIYKIGAPEQVGNAENNPLIEALHKRFGGK